MRKELKVLSCVALLMGVGTAQTVAISGTVTNATGGAALANVNVSLKNRTGVVATTGADGKYQLSSTAVIRLESGLKVFAGSRLNGSVLEFGATGEAAVSVELFTASGSKVATLLKNNAPAPGNYNVDLAAQRLVPTVYFVRYRQGTAAAIYRYVPTGSNGGRSLASGNAGGSAHATSLSKENDGVALDTLIFALSGFDSTRVPISSYTGQYNAVLEPQPAVSPPAGMKAIPGGTYTMGVAAAYPLSFYANPPHQVTISALFVDSIEVTQRDFKALMDSANPSPQYGSNLGDSLPVCGSSWFDAVIYCNARSKRDGKDTVYSYSSVSGTPGNHAYAMTGLNIDLSKKGYRLPSEAEWEYYGRAGTTTKYYWGDSMDGSYCWYWNNSNGYTHVGAEKKPNNWGLYDISGNVWEWTNDWWAECYPDSAQTNPTGPDTGSYRVLRGGAWGPNDDNIDFMQIAAIRSYGGPSWGNGLQYGFRVVCPQ